MQVCKIEGLGFFPVEELQEKCNTVVFELYLPWGHADWTSCLGHELSFTQGPAGAKYRCADRKNELKLLKLLGYPPEETQKLTLEQVQQWAKANGYTVEKKPAEAHKTPSVLFTAELDGDSITGRHKTLEALLLSLQEQMFEEHEIAQMKFYEVREIDVEFQPAKLVKKS